MALELKTTQLPVLGQAQTERADAARNRERILCAARRLLAENSIDCVSMEAIAEAAEVGKGTLFRRFGDRASLLHALLDEREKAFQDSFISGPPPLGPGAPPCERLIAFGHGMLDVLEESGELVLAADSGSAGARFAAHVYGAHRAHVRSLLVEGAPDVDPDYMADALLAALAAEVVMHQRRGRGVALEELRVGWTELARRVML